MELLCKILAGKVVYNCFHGYILFYVGACMHVIIDVCIETSLVYDLMKINFATDAAEQV